MNVSDLKAQLAFYIDYEKRLLPKEEHILNAQSHSDTAQASRREALLGAVSRYRPKIQASAPSCTDSIPPPMPAGCARDSDYENDEE
jgi:hypothetical protein